jgi:hypothetical protein
VQTDGKILVGGNFDMLGGQSRNCIGRLNPDGTLDLTFSPAAGSGYFYGREVFSLALQPDGRILVSGQFEALDGESRTNFARLNNTEPATQTVSFDGAKLSWLRSGSSPEVSRTTFEYSSEGGSWTHLGDGIRVSGGWELGGLTLPTNATIRARGYVATAGYYRSSSSLIETILRLPATGGPILDIGITGGVPMLGLSGELGWTYVLEYLPALKETNSWLPLATLVLTNNPQYYWDESAMLSTQRFYRARSP